MASLTREQWKALGRDAILDLLNDRLVVPWKEVEARIAYAGWKEFPKVQPLQLHEARISLQDEGLIIGEATQHRVPVVTVRLPFTEGKKREIERLRGRKREKYRRYLKWTRDKRLCGKQAERVVLASLKEAASAAGLWVPQQAVGHVNEIKRVPIQSGPLDAWAHVLELEPQNPVGEVSAVFEVKNILKWIYPWTRELWELLVKTASVATQTPVLPVLACVRYAYPAQLFAGDAGFFLCALQHQVFSPHLDNPEFQEIIEEFGLYIVRHEGPMDHVVRFLTKTLRRSPPLSLPEEDIPWYQRQVERFRTVAPVILDYQSLAGNIQGEQRTRVFEAFKAQAKEVFSWPSAGGW